jgi:hypothetical protein
MGYPQRVYRRRPSAHAGARITRARSAHASALITRATSCPTTPACTTIPSNVHVGNALCGRDNTTLAPVTPTLELSPTARPSNEHGRALDWCTNGDQARTPVKATPQSYSPTSTGAAMMPAEGEARHQPMPGARICEDDGHARRIVRQYATSVHFIMRHTCNYLPLAYKRRRKTPSRGHVHTITLNSSHCDVTPLSHPHFHLTILVLASITLAGTWRICPLSRLACSPPLQAPRCKII